MSIVKEWSMPHSNFGETNCSSQPHGAKNPNNVVISQIRLVRLVDRAGDLFALIIMFAHIM